METQEVQHKSFQLISLDINNKKEDDNPKSDNLVIGGFSIKLRLFHNNSKTPCSCFTMSVTRWR